VPLRKTDSSMRSDVDNDISDLCAIEAGYVRDDIHGG